MWINDLLTPKSERNKEIYYVLTVFVVAVGLFSLDWFNGFHGGVSTVGAERVLAGDIPYRDFWTMYAPGHFYLLALLFRVFGKNYQVEIVSATVVSAAATASCYLLARNLGNKRLAALTCATVFLTANYNTGYHRHLGSYPCAILFIFLALNCIALYYKTKRRNLLLWAGTATGSAIIFKHDIGGYTAIAIVTGLVVYHCVQWLQAENPERLASLLIKIVVFSLSIAIVILPVLLYFAVLAWPDMVKNLVTFPLTDFRFARPESYPSLSPLSIYDSSLIKLLENLCKYLIFGLPFVFFLLGIVTVGLAFYRRRPDYAALGATFSLAYFFHYSAAHVQINTHVISMSVYGALLVLLFLELAKSEYNFQVIGFRRLCGVAVAAVWLLSLAAAPAYKKWVGRRESVAVLNLPKVSGIRVSSEEARNLTELSNFVNASIPPDQPIFIGLNRHDVVVYGDVMLYFILNRPNATRYQELHPAITDTAPIQREIVNDLRGKKIPLIILKQLFSDEVLDEVKKDFLKHLPIGATELDDYIRENYAEVRRFGSYQIWQRREDAFRVAPSSLSSMPARMEKHFDFAHHDNSGEMK